MMMMMMKMMTKNEIINDTCYNQAHTSSSSLFLVGRQGKLQQSVGVILMAVQ